jgi:hypothetical protein
MDPVTSKWNNTDVLQLCGSAGLSVDNTSISQFRIVLQDEDRNELQCSLPWDLSLSIEFKPSVNQRMEIFRPIGFTAQM